jgi:hypothetical protein
MARYFVVRPDQVKAYAPIRDMHHERDGWRIMTEVKTRKGTRYGRVLEQEANGNIRHARFTSEAEAAAAIPEVSRR